MDFVHHVLWMSILFVVIAYVHFSLKPKNDVQILQATLQNITDSVLYEKYPIVIHDQLVDAEALTRTLFKYQFAFSRVMHLAKSEKHTSSHKFLIAHNNQSTSNMTINITSPSTKHPPVDVLLPPYAVLIVPYKWTISCDTDTSFILLNDYIHALFASSSSA